MLPVLPVHVQVPRGVYTDTGEIKYVCASRGYTAEWQRKVYFSFMTSYILVVPLVVITFCYANVILTIRRQCYDAQRSDVISSSLLCSDSQRNDDCVKLRRSNANKDAILRAKIRTIKMTLCIICGFVACWSPYFVAHLIDIWTNKQHKVGDVKSFSAFA
jgi:neuropeptide S receptor 1